MRITKAASDFKRPIGVTRRTFLSSAAALGGVMATRGFAAARTSRPFFAAHGLPVGLQLYTLGDAPYKDLDGTLKAVADIGYRRVEAVGFMNRSASEFRAALERAGLSCPSTHVPLQPGETWGGPGVTLVGDIGKLAADIHTIGAKYVVVTPTTIPYSWRHAVRQLNEAGAAVKREGLKLACHNYNIEFAKYGSKTGYELLLEHTDPDLVCFEMDVGWVATAGVDPIPLLRAHRGRFRLMHVKDVKAGMVPNITALKTDPADLGSGSLDWKAILPAGYDAGVRYYYVEQEPPFTEPRIKSARTDYEYLARI